MFEKLEGNGNKKREASLLAPLLFDKVENIPLLPVSCVSALLALAVRYFSSLYHSVECCIANAKPVLYLLCAHHRVKHIREYVLAERFYIIVAHTASRHFLAVALLLVCLKARIGKRLQQRAEHFVAENLSHSIPF